MTEAKKPRWSRRRWIAEHFGSDLADVETYQRPRDTGGVQLFQTGGRICAVLLPGDNREKLEKALNGWDMKASAHWRDSAVTVFIEKGSGGG